MIKILKNPIVLILLAIILLLAGAKVGSFFEWRNKPDTKVIISSASQVDTTVASTPKDKPKSPPPSATTEIQVKPEDPVLGIPGAKVAIVEFGDFQCPFCERFFKETEPQLRKEYVDTGKAKFVFKNLAFLGKESIDAANAALCAKEQNKFWEYHDKLYQNQMGENEGSFAIPVLKRFAQELGLEATQFNDCLDNQKYGSQVQADSAEVQGKGYYSTPTTFINGSVIVGAQPYATFKTVIDEKLAEAK